MNENLTEMRTDLSFPGEGSNPTPPKVSVIVPVYKVEKYLPECIESILAQTFTDFELILVDDGSPDNSGKICDDYASRDPRIRVFHKENGGVSSARNLGIKNAQSDYIAFLDSDDWWKPEFLEKMLALAQKYPQAGCCCCCWMTFSTQTGESIPGFLPGWKLGDMRLIDMLSHSAGKGHFPIWTGAVLLKKNILNEIGRFDETLMASEDCKVWFEFVLRAPVAYLNDSLAFYRKDVPAENKPRWASGRKRTDIERHWVSHLAQYSNLERTNPTVKLFLDRFRLYCLLAYRNDESCKDTFLRVYKEIDRKSFTWQYRIAYSVPPIAEKILSKAYLVLSRVVCCVLPRA